MPARVPLYPSLQELGTHCHSHNILISLTTNVWAPGITYSIGAMYLSSGNSIHKDIPNGLETALGESNHAACSRASRSAQPQWLVPGTSVLLFLSSLPRYSKGPIPATLTVTSAVTGLYYGALVFEEYR